MKTNSRNILSYMLLCSFLVLLSTGFYRYTLVSPGGEQATQQPAGEQPAQTGEPDGKPTLGSTAPPTEVLPWTGVLGWRPVGHDGAGAERKYRDGKLFMGRGENRGDGLRQYAAR
jgi:hypothetical protein